MKSAAILIGLNSYPSALRTANLAQLSGAVHDCQDVAKFLLDYGLIDPNYLYAYVYDTATASAQVDGAQPLIAALDIPLSGVVPRETLVKALDTKIEYLGNQEVKRLFVYLSGHGGDLTQAVPPLSVLLTSDYVGTEKASNYGMLVTDHIQNYVHNARNISEAIIISDSCRSSLATRTVTPFLGSAPLFKKGTRCLTIKASVHSEPAIEEELTPGRVVGTFTYLLLQELRTALDRNPTGSVYWRDICDAVAEKQTGNSDGQLLDYQQVTAYPIMEVRAASPAVAAQPTQQVKLRSLVFWPERRAATNSGIGSLTDLIERATVNIQQPVSIPASANTPASRIIVGDMATKLVLPMNKVSIFARQRRQDIGTDVHLHLEELGDGLSPEANPEEVYKYRSLINGMTALNNVFDYLTHDEQEHLKQATRILASEGDPRALERLNGEFSTSEWDEVTAFLRYQARAADPLWTVDAPAQDNGFTLKVIAVTDNGDSDKKWVRVTLQVDGKEANFQPDTVRVYQHPSLLPVIRDVAFTERAATFVMTISFGFTVAVKVDGGPLLKLSRSVMAHLLQHFRKG